MSERSGDAVHDAVALARLALDDESAARVVAECRRVVDAWRGLPPHDEQVGPPVCALPLADVLRDDEPEPSLAREDALGGAADVADGAFRVPRVADVA